MRYRLVDFDWISPLDFMMSPTRNAEAAQRFGLPPAVITRLQAHDSAQLCKSHRHTRTEGGLGAADVGQSQIFFCIHLYVLLPPLFEPEAPHCQSEKNKRVGNQDSGRKQNELDPTAAQDDILKTLDRPG